MSLISGRQKSILVSGGYYGSPVYPVNLEIISEESSLAGKKLAELRVGIYGGPTLFLHDHNVLLCGGFSNENKCLMLDNDSWKLHSNLNQWRISASAVTTANGTFLFGGDGYGRKTYEFLPKYSKFWNQGRMNIPNDFRIGCALEVPDKREILLIEDSRTYKRIPRYPTSNIVRDIASSRTYKRILKFDIETQASEVLNVSLLKERHGHTCGRFPNTNLIVITGGKDGNYNIHDTSEFLNLDDNTITLGNPMNTKRFGHGMAVISINNEDRLAVFGVFSYISDIYSCDARSVVGNKP